MNFDGGHNFTITGVYSGSPADHAGVKAGDRIDMARLYPIRDRTLDPVTWYRPAGGSHITLPMIRGSRNLIAGITLGASPTALGVLAIEIVGILFVFMAFAIAAYAVVVQPNLMTWSLLAFLLGDSTAGITMDMLSPFGYPATVIGNLISGIYACLIPFVIVFAAREPNNSATGWRRRVQLFVPVLSAAYFYVYVWPTIAWSILGLPGRIAFYHGEFASALPIAVFTIALVIFAASYLVVRQADRARTKWVALGVIAWALVNAVQLFVNQSSFNDENGLVINAGNAIHGAAVASIAYGIVRSHVVDVTFAISRAFVVAAIAGFIVALFALIDYVFEKRLEATRLGTITEICTAIALGFWLNALHRRVDTFVDRSLFRRRYEAERRLAAASKAILHTDHEDAVREFLIDEPQSALQLASAALFEPEGNGDWNRTAAIGWNAESPQHLLSSDTLVLHLEAQQAPLKTSSLRWPVTPLPEGKAHPRLAVPILARHRVIAIAVYGQHENGTDLDADEIRSLEVLADAAGAAFDHVQVEATRAKMEAFRLQAESFRHDAERLQREVDALIRPSAHPR